MQAHVRSFFRLLPCSLALACATAQTLPPETPVKAVTAVQPQEPPATHYYEEAQQAIARKDWAAAKSQLGFVLAKEPENADANFDAGHVAEQLGDLDVAARSYLKALAAKPDHTGAVLNLGRVLRHKEQYKEAIHLYSEALKTLPQDVKLLNNLSVVYRLDRQFDKAEAALRKILARAPKNADAYKNLALVYYDQGKFRLAQTVSANALKLDANDPGVYNNLGMIDLKLDDQPGAMAQFKKAIEKEPNFIPALSNLGAMALRYRDYAAAETNLAKVAAALPASYDAHIGYAFALDGLKKVDPAVAEYERALALKKDAPEALYGVALGYKAQKKLPQALEALDQYQRIEGTAHKADAVKLIATIKAIMNAGTPKAAPTVPPPAVKAEPADSAEVSKATASPAPVTAAPGGGGGATTGKDKVPDST